MSDSAASMLGMMCACLQCMLAARLLGPQVLHDCLLSRVCALLLRSAQACQLAVHAEHKQTQKPILVHIQELCRTAAHAGSCGKAAGAADSILSCLAPSKAAEQSQLIAQQHALINKPA